MKLFIGADHRGFQFKELLKAWLTSQGHDVKDCGNGILDPADDYPDYAFAVAEEVARLPDSRGIVVCGSGIGVTIAANKVKGARCSLAATLEEVRLGRGDDDINILALSSNFAEIEAMKQAIDIFLQTPFKGEERHVRRLQKIANREAAWLR